MITHVLILTILLKLSLCRDFYVGMFKKNDLLVAQDTLYKEKNYFGFTRAKYGRAFKCPITYFRVSDRLGVGRPPAVTITRGGLQKKYITLLLTSTYNTPIAVNIYIGCENKLADRTTTSPTTAASEKVDGKDDATIVVGEGEGGDEAEGGAGEGGGDAGGGDAGGGDAGGGDAGGGDAGGGDAGGGEGGEGGGGEGENAETTPPPE